MHPSDGIFKKVIIAGTRTFCTEEHYALLVQLLDGLCEIYGQPEEIVSGCARGADRLGERWAESRGINITRFPSDWDTYGKRAGMLRNQDMGNYADTLVAFWDGESRGTKHMIDFANMRGLEVILYNYQ
jgi:hypothetical protein